MQTVSWLKAAAVAPRIDDGLVLAADTIAWINDHPILKPADEADARRILREMAGREHDLWTGVSCGDGPTMCKSPGRNRHAWPSLR